MPDMELFKRIDDLVQRVEGFMVDGCNKANLEKLHYDLKVIASWKTEADWIVVIGDIVDGYSHYGPYDTEESAESYAGDNPNAHVIKLISDEDAP